MKLIFMFLHNIQSFSKLLIFSYTVSIVSLEITDVDSYVKGKFRNTFQSLISVTVSESLFQ